MNNFSQNQFFNLRVISLVYRIKLDKIIFALLAVFFLTKEKLHFGKLKKVIKKLEKGTYFLNEGIFERKITEVEKIEKKMRKSQNLKNSIILISCVDIFFYCGHEILHRKKESILKNLEYFISYIFSILIFVLYTGFYYKFTELACHSKLKKKNKIKYLNKKKKMKKIFEGLPVNGVRYRLRARETELEVKKDKFIESFINEGVSEKGKEKAPRTFNVIFSTRIIAITLPLLVFQSSVQTQLVLLLSTELIFSVFLIVLELRAKVFEWCFEFFIRILESIFLMSFFVFCFLVKNGFRDSQFYDGYELFVLCFFLFVVFLEYVQLCLISMLMMKKIFKKFKGKKILYQKNFQRRILNHEFIRMEIVGNEGFEEVGKVRDKFSQEKEDLKFRPQDDLRIGSNKKLMKMKRNRIGNSKQGFCREGMRGKGGLGLSLNMRKKKKMVKKIEKKKKELEIKTRFEDQFDESEEDKSVEIEFEFEF